MNKPTQRPRGLGKGVEALFLSPDSLETTAIVTASAKSTNNAPAVQMIAVAAIVSGRFQPRKSFDDSAALELTESVRLHGVLQPIMVRYLPEEQHYELIAGERRWRASKAAGLETIPALVRTVTDQQMMLFGLIENLQRENLNCLEEAEGIARIVNEHHITHEKTAELLSKSRSAITNALRLLDLSEGVKPMIRDGLLEMGHARALLPLPAAKQKLLAELIIDHRLSVREVEKRAKLMLQTPIGPTTPSKTRAHSADHHIAQVIQELEETLGLPVDLTVDKQGAGHLKIRFSKNQQLQWLLNRLIPSSIPPLSTPIE